jgi:Rhodopirellula transposase DDE domain
MRISAQARRSQQPHAASHRAEQDSKDAAHQAAGSDTWERTPAVPYGVYDVTHNRGTIYVGTSGATAQFAVDAIAQWWQTKVQMLYPQAAQLLNLADGGGRDGCRARLWKQQLQEQLCDGLGLTVTVCHYPPGGSKGNPVEHRLFGPISLNWAGTPLRTWETMLAYVRGMTTTTGLDVRLAGV